MDSPEVLFAIMNGIPIEKKIQMLIRFINKKNLQEQKMLQALKINITYTICNEVEVNLCVRLNSIANFAWLVLFSEEMIKAKKENKDFNIQLTEDIFSKVNEIAEKTQSFANSVFTFKE